MIKIIHDICIIVIFAVFCVGAGQLIGFNDGFDMGVANQKASEQLKSCNLRHNGVLVE